MKAAVALQDGDQGETYEGKNRSTKVWSPLYMEDRIHPQESLPQPRNQSSQWNKRVPFSPDL
jgi:hypothetical protein